MSATRKLRRLALRGTSFFLVFLFFTAVIVRLTVRDHYPYLAALYYAMPLPLLSVNAALVSFCSMLLCRWRLAAVWSLLAVTGAVWSWWALVVGPGGERRHGDLQIVCWNVANGWFRWDSVLESILDREADIVGLVEVGRMSAETRAEWSRALSGYVLTEHQGGKMIIARGALIGFEEGLLGRSGSYQLAKLSRSSGLIHILMVDLHSDPLKYRREPLEVIASLVADLEGPVIIMGDFNMPGDSVHFGVLGDDYVNAFDESGSGYAPTWPLPWPVLQLDHIWVNNAVVVTEAEAGWEMKSDHRSVVAWVDLLPDEPTR